MKPRTFCLVLVVCWLASADALAQTLAGFGSVVLTEDAPHPLGGYGDRRGRPSEGVHDDITAKAMVLESAGLRIAIVSCDLIGISRDFRDDLVAKLPEKLGIGSETLMLTAAHNHSGYGAMAKPAKDLISRVALQMILGTFDPALYDRMLSKIAGILESAVKDLRPARLGWGFGSVDGLISNRAEDGGPTDTLMGVLKVEGADGALRGLFVRITGHPTVLPGWNMQVSADWPGAFQRKLEKDHPGATALFVNGAEGDQRVKHVDWDTPENSPPLDKLFGDAQAVGENFAARVENLLPRIKTGAEFPLSCRFREVTLPPRKGISPFLRAETSYFQTMTLGGTLLIGIPGEPCALVGRDLTALAKRAGHERALVVGLANDHLGYFVHESDYAEGDKSHQYEKSANAFGEGINAWFLETFSREFFDLPAKAPEPGPALAPADEEY